MKLFYSPTSPFVRKVMACAIARGIDGRIETVRSNPHESPADLVRANPLSKVPCLVTDDGMALFDSPVICEYLDSIGDAPKLFPAAGAARWRALKLQAMGDGILDAAVLRRGEMGRPKESARDAFMARQAAAVSRTLDQLEAEPPGGGIDIGAIAVACALGYLDFRYAAEPWRQGRERLARWYKEIEATKAIARTAPKE
ncbi:MAG TPA: glutathione S-transferase N-terminal domain-containing protein [Acetobacteraceae bacterium]|nr:glutathione S-transferase N-terminal domain-containing protein [Acetobacteraceae bacterium]